MDRRKLMIKFYDNPNTDDLNILLKDKDASISYNGIRESVDIIVRDFIGYWKKISYNLSDASQEGLNLDRSVKSIIKSGINKEINVLYDEKPGFSVNIVNERLRAIKVYQSILEDSSKIPFSLVFLKCSWGGEEYYAPKSVLIFLDLIIRNLSEDQLQVFNNESTRICNERLENYIGYSTF
jgi:hypothetical protein